MCNDSFVLFVNQNKVLHCKRDLSRLGKNNPYINKESTAND